MKLKLHCLLIILNLFLIKNENTHAKSALPKDINGFDYDEVVGTMLRQRKSKPKDDVDSNNLVYLYQNQTQFGHKLGFKLQEVSKYMEDFV